MAKGISITDKSARDAFKEVGEEHADIKIVNARGKNNKGTKIVFQLPTGEHGILHLKQGYLPDARAARQTLIHHVIQKSRSQLAK
jgi:hypothetical protein